MILVWAPFPARGLVREGWMRRIAAVDRLFAKRERHYAFHADPQDALRQGDYRIAERRVDGVPVTSLDLRFTAHQRRLTELVERCDLVYAHTAHSSRALLPYYATGKVITDLHGLAPEEEAMQGRPARSRFFAALERVMVHDSAALVTVTEAMTAHLHEKYPDLRTPTIALPVVEDTIDESGATEHAAARDSTATPTVVYAGGLQPWQNVERMFATLAASRRPFRFVFCTDAVDEARRRARAAGVERDVDFRFCPPAELATVYRRADYGFVLRDDDPVNRVSCPTKLAEYLAHGVVPIVDLAEIGDFASLGYRYVRRSDLLDGRLPDPAELDAMRAQNVEVYRELRRIHDRGSDTLAAIAAARPRLDVAGCRSVLMSAAERAFVFADRCGWLRCEREDDTHAVTLDDLPLPPEGAEVRLPGRGRLRSLRFVPFAPPFVTTPIEVELLRARGDPVPLRVGGTFETDRFGNWCFRDADAYCEATSLDVDDPVALRLGFELALAGPEVAWARPRRFGFRRGGVRR